MEDAEDFLQRVEEARAARFAFWGEFSIKQ
jgi:hypothetical protein